VRGAQPAVTLEDHPSIDIAHFAGTVADIARTLESPHEADSRIAHVLTLVRRLVPCDRCALYRNGIDPDAALIVEPPPAPSDRPRLAMFLAHVLRFLEEGGERPHLFNERVHLALPVIGRDDVLGVLFVDRERSQDYEPHHLRLLSAVCSQLGAYLMMGKLHEETAQQATLLMDREQQLQGTARFREEFIGVIGHDLRNPLSAIRTGAYLLMNRAGLDERDFAVAERVAASADRMSRMIDELMDFARGRLGGGIPLRRTLVDLEAICKDVVGEVQTVHNRRVTLDVLGETYGYWDADRLAQLLSNLVGNALQHSPAGSAVGMTVHDEDECTVVQVHNQGPPIPEEQLRHIFEPFRRGDGPKSEGLGLGLYIVERIVHAHGGAITVRSTEREGTTFSVRIPRRRASDRGTSATPVRRTSAP
jgi:signal transduction histidine kinase